MSLKYIIQNWAKETGQPIASSGQRANALEKINKAARELYDSSDLPGSLREQVFDVDASQHAITLPYYVGQVRGVRKYNFRDRVKLNDMRPRYSVGHWIDSCFTWRIKQVLPLARNLTNEAPLRIDLTEAASQAFSLFIKMSTSTKSSVVEQINWVVGDTFKITTNAPTSFPGIQNIEKSQLINEDMIIRDASSVEVARIPNNELQSRYSLLQIVDENMIMIQIDPCYEILYKISLSPFFSDYDVFPCEGYDDVILWKAVSNFWKTKPGSSEKVITAEQTLAQILAQKAANAEAGEELEMNFAFSRFNDLYGYPTGYFNNYGRYVR